MGRLARGSIDSKLTPLFIITSLLLGVAAVLMLPREEEPQIKVPIVDVLVAMPGFSAREVEERATRPMEKEPAQYVFFVEGAARSTRAEPEPAVTLTIAKRPGANAVQVADQVLRKVDTLRGLLLPADVRMTVTRNYGETASAKSNELLFRMGIAIVGVSVLMWLTLGWRESFIVAIAIPCTLALTLLVFYLLGFTLNRITLFALIFSIGILVDDAIVILENVARHFHLPQHRGWDWSAIAVEAVQEVGNPTLLATFAVIAAVLPMAFVGGLMGPHMRPIPMGATAAMFFSLAVAFMVTPWAAHRILRVGGKYAARPPRLPRSPTRVSRTGVPRRSGSRWAARTSRSCMIGGRKRT